MKKHSLLILLCLVNLVSNAQVFHETKPDSLLLKKFQDFRKAFDSIPCDTIFEISDTTTYKVRFKNFGGFSSYRNVMKVNITSIESVDSPEHEPCFIRLNPKDSGDIEFGFETGDLFNWQSYDLFEFPRSRAFVSYASNNANDSVIRRTEFFIPSGCLAEDFRHFKPTIRSYNKQKYLILIWPLTLQYGGETDSGIQATYFLERIEN